MNRLERLIGAVDKGMEMREAQRQYFKTRDRECLVHSKKLEAEFDKLAKDAMRPDDLLEGGQ